MVLSSDGGGWDRDEGSTTAATSLIVSIALPAFSIDEQISFHVKPSCHEKVIDGVEDIVHAIASDLQSELISVDKDGSQRKMDHLRKRAMDDVKEWQAKLKDVEEWKLKVKRANEKMNTMRDAYFKELFHLREQVYQQKKAEKAGSEFQPCYALHFDPADYHTDEQVIGLVNDKVSLIQQEYATKFTELDQKYASRLKALNDQVSTSKLLLTRKDKLLRKAENAVKMLQQGQAVEKQTVEAKATEEFLEIEAENNKAEEKPVEIAESERFHQYLEKKFGSLREARVKIGLKRKLDTNICISEFKDLIKDIGYECQDEKVFSQLTSAALSNTLFDLLERPSERRQPPARRGSCDLTATTNKDSANMSLKDMVDNPKSLQVPRRRHSVGTTIPEGIASEFSDAKESLPPAASVSEKDEELSDLEDNSFEGSYSSGDETATLAGRSTVSKRTSGTVRTQKSRRGSVGEPSKMVQKAASIFSRMAKPSSRHQRKGEAEIQTTIHYNSGIQAAFSANVAIPEIAEKTVDTGTDALPYYAAFPKVKLRSCGTQSQIDARMLDKAMDFYDNEAEDNWNMLAGIMKDSDTESEVPRGSPPPRDSPILEPKQDAGGADAAAGMAEKVAEVVASSDTGGSGEGPGAAPGESGDEKNAIKDRGTSKDRPKYASNLCGPIPAWNFTSRQAPLRRAEPRTCTFADFGALERGTLCENITRVMENRSVTSRDIAALPPETYRKPAVVEKVAPETADVEIQCQMFKLVMVNPLEKRFPEETDSVDNQIQQIIDVANEMEERAPELKERATQLAGQLATRGGSEKDRKLLEQLNRIRFAPMPTKAPDAPSDRGAQSLGAPARDAAPKLSTGSKAAPSVEELLARHGIDGEAQDCDNDMGRHTTGGVTRRAPPAAPSASAPRRASGQFRFARPPPVRVLQNGSREKLGDAFMRNDSLSPSKSEHATSMSPGMTGRRWSASNATGASASGRQPTPRPSSGDRAQMTPSPNPIGDRCLATPSPNPQPSSAAADKDSDFGGDSDGDGETPLTRNRPASTAVVKKKTVDATQFAAIRARRKSNERIEMATEVEKAEKADTKAEETPTSDKEPAKLADGWSGLVGEQSFTSRGRPAEISSASGGSGLNSGTTSAADSPQSARKASEQRPPLRRVSTTTLSLGGSLGGGLGPEGENAGATEPAPDDLGQERTTFTDQRMSMGSARMTDNGRVSMFSDERQSRVTFSDMGEASPRNTGNTPGRSSPSRRPGSLRNLATRQKTRELGKGNADSSPGNERTTDMSRFTANSNRMTSSTYQDDTCAFNDADDFGAGIEDTMLEEFTSEKMEAKLGGKRQLGWSQTSAVPTGMPAGMRGGQGLTSPDPPGEAFRKLPSIATAAAGSSSSSSTAAPKVSGCQTMSLSEDVGADLRVRPGHPGEHSARRGSSSGTGDAKPLNSRILSKVQGAPGAKASPRPGLGRLGSGAGGLGQGAPPEMAGERNTCPTPGNGKKEKKDDEVHERRTFAEFGEEDLLKDLDHGGKFFSNKSTDSAANAHSSEEPSIDFSPKMSSDFSPKGSRPLPGRPASQGRNFMGLSLTGTQASAKAATPRKEPERAVKPLKRIGR